MITTFDVRGLLIDGLICLLYALIVAGVRVASSYVIPYVKSKLESTKYEWVAAIVDDTVHAYEQLIPGEHQGSRRYEHVYSDVVKELKKLGIDVNEAQISTLIESAVHRMNAEGVIVDVETETGFDDVNDEYDSNEEQ